MKSTNSSERGNSILEFALCASLFLVPMLAGAWTVGMALVKALQVGQVARDANILVVRGIDLSRSDNQSLVVKTAQGLGINLAGTNTPDPNGLGVVILSTIHRVSSNDCAAEGYNPSGTLTDGATTIANYPDCPNFLYYVFKRRILFGNSSKLNSVLGNPSDTPQSDGTLTETQFVTHTGNQAPGFPGRTLLNPTDAGATSGLVFTPIGADAFICEVGFDISAMNIFSIPKVKTIYARHIS